MAKNNVNNVSIGPGHPRDAEEWNENYTYMMRKNEEYKYIDDTLQTISYAAEQVKLRVELLDIAYTMDEIDSLRQRMVVVAQRLEQHVGASGWQIFEYLAHQCVMQQVVRLGPQTTHDLLMLCAAVARYPRSRHDSSVIRDVAEMVVWQINVNKDIRDARAWDPSNNDYDSTCQRLEKIMVASEYALRTEVIPNIRESLERIYDRSFFTEDPMDVTPVYTISLTDGELRAVLSSLDYYQDNAPLPPEANEKVLDLTAWMSDMKDTAIDSYYDTPLYVSLYSESQYYGGPEEGGWYGQRTMLKDYIAVARSGWFLGQTEVTDPNVLDIDVRENYDVIYSTVKKFYEMSCDLGPEDELPSKEDFLAKLGQSVYGWWISTKERHRGDEYFTVAVERKLGERQKGRKMRYE